MPVKRLELFNFKSYRGSQVINLGDAPFTCIIGPNGAGKSNLMDAISFVLGVKSAQLRSTQLKDLVYRGRKALQVEGEDGMDVDEETQPTQVEGDLVDARSAWVMAVYEDDKAKEWKFKRSIATSGQSSYFLNAKAVPWATYNAQLEKFNILVKAKNFLVFQGDVEGVASQDSRALAKLIDRISGSLDLAPQYEAAKLAQDKATGTTIDIHAKKKSLSTEVRHFKKQREEIRQWEKMNEEKDAMIQRHLLWRLYHITSQINESTKQVEQANAKLSGLRKSVDKNDSTLSETKKNQAQSHLNVKKREGSVKKAEKVHEDKKPEMLAVDTQISHAIKKSKNAAALAERVERDESRQEEDLKALEKGMKDIERSIKEAAAKQREKSQAAGKTLSKAELDEYRNLRSQANTLAVAERQQIDGLRRELKTLRDALSSVEDRIAQAERQKAKISSEIDGLAEREEQTSDKVTELNQERDRVKAQLEHAQAERLRINMKETEINDRLQDTYSQLLQAGVDKRETEREAKLKETISSLKRVFPGVLGRVVDLCRAHQSKYDKAIMTVLGRNIDSVVVEHEKTAIECIEYMRNQRLGQATFIPLDTIQIKPIQERLREFRGAKLAVECVEPRSGAERALQFVCGNTLICDNLEVARYVCYEKNADAKAVTLDGTVIHKSGNMTGGQGSGGDRKFDDRRVEGLKKLKETYMNQLKELHQSKPKENADEMLLQNLARLDAEHSIAKDDLDATHLRLTDLRKELKHVESEIKKHTPEREKRLKEARAGETKLSTLQETIDEADDSVFAAFCRKIKVASIRDYEDIQLRAAREENEVMEKYSQQKARASHQVEFEKNQLVSTRERLASLRSTVEKENANVKKLEMAKRAIEAELEELAGEVELQRGKLQKAAAALEEATEAVENAREAARKTQKMLDRALKEIAVWNDDIEKGSSDRHAIYRRCRLEEIDLPLEKGSLDKVPIEETNRELAMDVDDDETQRPAETEDFGIVPDFEDLEDVDKEDGSEEIGKDFETQISKMKADLEKLVPNMKAIERLADVQAGLDDTEKEVEAARRETKRAKDEFQDLRKKRCDLFNKAYQHMHDCIDRIYKDLTKTSSNPSTGGVAFLSLEDSDEPYLSGVRYNVMPPGKNFVETEQLSGGEKTMAALALLFSIHSFHPAPFFVLDEVDAALDATNVSKLARYIQKESQGGVQFLIISLKSSLYERSDGLVGVYREQEENSSRTLTLDLRKYDD